MKREIRTPYLVAFVVIVLAIVVPIVVRLPGPPAGPSVEVVGVDGQARTITAAEIEALSPLCRRGTYQNQFGNWRDAGEYCGVLLTELIGEDAAYQTVTVVAEDGYQVEIERWRIVDPEYPVILATSFDGQAVPGWSNGYRIAVLPEDGDVSNAEYGVESAGSYWVKNVVRLVLRSE